MNDVNMQASLPVSSLLRKAQRHVKAEELAKAAILYREALFRFPKNKKAIQEYHNLKNLIASQNALNSEVSQEQAQELIRLYEQGKFKEVLSKANYLTNLFPKAMTLYDLRGATNAKLKNFDEAINIFKQALKMNPNHLEAYLNIGNVLQEKGELDAAIDSYKQALKLKSDYAEVHYNMGIALKKKGDLDAAIFSNKQVIKIVPDHVEAFNNMGNALQAKEDIDGAISSYKKALKINPNHAEANYNIGNALKEKGQLDSAIKAYNAATHVKPDYADALCNLSIVKNLQGDLKNGFELYEWRCKIRDPLIWPARSQFVWSNNKPINGKHFFIYEEQGIGDVIQFSRYLPLLEQKGAKVSFEVRSNLHALLQTMDSRVSLRTSFPEESKIDFEAPLMSLPNLFNTSLETIPATNPYLYADHDRTRNWGERFGKDRFKIGICWQGSKSKVDFGRSFPLSLFEGISKTPNVELISLHKGEGEDQIANIDFHVTTLGPDFDAGPDAFVDTAAVMMNCDLIITSDTAVAHLAGALGCPTWVALKYVPDWRWMLDRSDSPWYPTMTLYRQKNSGDWACVFNALNQDLRFLIDQKGK